MTTPIYVEFPDPEALLVSYLSEHLPARGVHLPVSTGVPLDLHGRPVAAYVRVRLLGGAARDSVIDEALFAIENHDGIDADTTEASQVAAAIRGLLATMPLHVPAIRRVREVGRPVPRTHPDSGAPSYTQTHQLTTRGY